MARFDFKHAFALPRLRVRLFPVLIGVAALVVAIKASGIWLELSRDAQAQDETAQDQSAQTAASGQTLAVDSADGIASGAAPKNDGATPSDEPNLAADGAAAPEAAKDSQDEAIADNRPPHEVMSQPDSAPKPIPDFQRSDLPADPFALTEQEIDILQTLAQRREELDQRGKSLEQREIMLSAAEMRLSEKVAELERLKAAIEDLLLQYDDKVDDQILSLVKIYGNMKPKDAARIFNELEMEVLLDVLDQMKERSSAAILAEMDPRRAKAVTLQLAQRDALPLDRE